MPPTHERQALPRRSDTSDRPHVLLRSSWQTVNIGDIAHTPGALRALRRFAPETDVTLWPVSLGEADRRMLEQAFPDVRIVDGWLDGHGQPVGEDLQNAWDQADVLMHGSAAGIQHTVSTIEAWRAHSARPYGFFGVTVDPVGNPGDGQLDELAHAIDQLPDDHIIESLREILDHAAFTFCRDTLSLRYLRSQQITCPLVEFGPDATFAFDIVDAEGGNALMQRHQLRPGEFIAVLPRLRYTPYHITRSQPPTAEDMRRDQVNLAMREGDLGKLRELIIEWVRATGLKVLACPEMTYEVEVTRDLCRDLPSDVADKVEWLPHYWLPHTAAAVYLHARALVSYECHSPIIGINQGVPSMYVRTPTDSIKGQMYRDIGLSTMTVEIDNVDGTQLLNWALNTHQNHDNAVSQVRSAHKMALEHLQLMVDATIKAATTA